MRLLGWRAGAARLIKAVATSAGLLALKAPAPCLALARRLACSAVAKTLS